MKKFAVSVMGAVALFATPALAADLVRKAPPPVLVAAPSPWDIAFGGAIASDYNFRGISQSDRGPSASAYFEPRFNLSQYLQFYVGLGGLSVKLPTTPTAEIDLYGGARITFGAFALDLGALYYYYPRERQLWYANAANTAVTYTNLGFGAFSVANTDFWEVYAKPSYTFNDMVTVGANLFYSPNWLGTGAPGTFLSGTAKVSFPVASFGAYVSGEVGRYWLGATTAYGAAPFFFTNYNLPDYTTWNLGVGLTYKAITLDLRYYDTDLTRTRCFLLTGDPRGAANLQSNWCEGAFVGKISFDTTLAAFK